MADNAQVIEQLYDAMNRHDGEAMAQLYAPDGRFHDPAFGELSGAEAGDMWRMLTGRATDLTGRPVVNDIHASFRVRDGRIVEHDDSFSFSRWARQALGPTGLILGLPPMNLLVRRRARGDLAEFRGEG